MQPIVAAERFVTTNPIGFAWIQKGKAYPVLIDKQEDKGVLRAVMNLQTDAQRYGMKPKWQCSDGEAHADNRFVG